MTTDQSENYKFVKYGSSIVWSFAIRSWLGEDDLPVPGEKLFGNQVQQFWKPKKIFILPFQLHSNEYDTAKALQALVRCPVPVSVEKKWNEEEAVSRRNWSHLIASNMSN